jgi:hypothetical protein
MKIEYRFANKIAPSKVEAIDISLRHSHSNWGRLNFTKYHRKEGNTTVGIEQVLTVNKMRNGISTISSSLILIHSLNK